MVLTPEILQMELDGGFSRVEIARKYDVDAYVISRMIKKYGIEDYVAFDEVYSEIIPTRDEIFELFYEKDGKIFYDYARKAEMAEGLSYESRARFFDAFKQVRSDVELEFLERTAVSSSAPSKLTTAYTQRDTKWLYGIILKHFGTLNNYRMCYFDADLISEIFPSNTSAGERAVAQVLEGLNIRFVQEERIENCRNIYKLPFDFAVYGQSGSLLGLIEYDGEQHYRPVELFGGKGTFEGTQHRDAIKTKYCADNGIPLLRIPHTEFDNIEAIVTNWITSLGKALQAA